MPASTKPGSDHGLDKMNDFHSTCLNKKLSFPVSVLHFSWSFFLRKWFKIVTKCEHMIISELE